MIEKYPLHLDPSTVAVNEDGDVMPPEDTVIPRANWADNRLSLEEDHEVVSKIQTARIAGELAAAKMMASPDTVTSDWPSAAMNRRSRQATQYGHVSGPSAERLRAADQAYLRQQSRDK